MTEVESDPLELSFLTKHIRGDGDIAHFNESPAYFDIGSTLEKLGQSVQSIPRSAPHTVRPIIQTILQVFDRCRVLIQETPPLQTPQRFGNRAFRILLSKIYNQRKEILSPVSDNPETWEYFVQSFGSWTRIDYGTGHEFNFLAYIVSLFKLGILEPVDSIAIVFDVFWSYWDLICEIQQVYRLEPAGSHGSWGLDDYNCLPFVFGAFQLIDHPEITPSTVLSQEISLQNAAEYSYCRWITYIYKMKFGNFAEHSRMLYSLRNVPHFLKLSGGMLKMYRGEIMDRFLVVQHFRFGTILKWNQ